MTQNKEQALATVRAMLSLGHPLETILQNSLIPAELREFLRVTIRNEETFVLTPARVVTADHNRGDWLGEIDRSAWHYWPALRMLLITKNWPLSNIRALDDSSDRILRQLQPPTTDRFDIRGLVLGFVQSGKTANYTALIAKAADAGYRLVIVLSGIDNGLRRQTNIRLKHELVGYTDNRVGAVKLPPVGKQWHEFTVDTLHGDFRPGTVNHATLQGSQPVLLVIKKNGAVLRRLLKWLEEAPSEVHHNLPFLLIDDKADLASVDTRGTYQIENDPPDEDYEEPSVINGLIRELLQLFDRRAYVAYTATPFANILIPHDTTNTKVGNDLYPKDFIIALPKPPGYFGAEEIFGRIDTSSGEDQLGLDIIREVTDADIISLDSDRIPASLETALLDFVLAGAARAQRGAADAPVTMLIHTSTLIDKQARLQKLVADRFGELRDGWRYQRAHQIPKLRDQWNLEICPVIRGTHPAREVAFELIEEFIGPFFEAVQVKQINSATGDILDYEREPSLKAIAIGGNRLSRGLTLEGLIVSFYVRRSVSYDTLMQMGRWFGFRAGYEDLTRIYTTPELEGWFHDLALVEHQLREDIQVYENLELTPFEVGMRILHHPAMQVTNPLKRRFASETVIAQSYAGKVVQTFKFPLTRLDRLAAQCDTNRNAVCKLVSRLGRNDAQRSEPKGPVWTEIDVGIVLEFLNNYSVDDEAKSISISLVCAYIQRLLKFKELKLWTVAVCGRGVLDKKLGQADWNLPSGPISQISRSRIHDTNSVGIITSPGDELAGLAPGLREKVRQRIANEVAAGREVAQNVAARHVRPPTTGLLLLYPISRHSAPEGSAGIRRPLYDKPNGTQARDVVGLALSFPESSQPQKFESYVEGTKAWNPN